MEHNRAEALSAKSIADEKFEKGDYLGAHRFALKAQTMFPGIKAVQKMLVETNVLISAEKKRIGGEIDWYTVLSVDPSANHDVIASRYRDLLLQLHPDKNECPGKDHTAFQLVLEGGRLLKDQSKRSAYDQRTGIRVSQQRFPFGPPAATRANGFTTGPSTSSNANAGPPVPTRANGFTAGPSTSSNANAGPPAPAKAEGSQKSTRGKTTVKRTKASPNTFWTMCTKCEYHYEYENIYKNHPLRCVNCEAVFRAFELDRSLVPKKHKRVVKKNSRANTSTAAKESEKGQPDLKKSECD